MMLIPWVLIDKLWNEGAPIQQFESVLDDWVQAYHEAKVLYTRFLRDGGTNEGTTDREECGQ
jgi:hypothetical protein